MKSILFFVLFLVFTLGCASQEKKTQIISPLLFPDGRYKQEVSVKVMAPDYNKNFDFDCFILKKPSHFMFVGYNSFGITLFKIKENEGQIEMESSIKEINEKRDFFLKVFDLVKTLVSIEKTDGRLAKSFFEINFQNIQSKVEFKDYDKMGIPRRIYIHSPEFYKIQILTTQFDSL